MKIIFHLIFFPGLYSWCLPGFAYRNPRGLTAHADPSGLTSGPQPTHHRPACTIEERHAGSDTRGTSRGCVILVRHPLDPRPPLTVPPGQPGSGEDPRGRPASATLRDREKVPACRAGRVAAGWLGWRDAFSPGQFRQHQPSGHSVADRGPRIVGQHHLGCVLPGLHEVPTSGPSIAADRDRLRGESPPRLRPGDPEGVPASRGFPAGP